MRLPAVSFVGAVVYSVQYKIADDRREKKLESVDT